MNLFFGCVEDRDDPLKLGRCRVRVAGLHTENKSELPTHELPWSLPLQPINSAGVSGIGVSPTGIVTGSWVAVTFLDDDKQYPIMMGTISGYPTPLEATRAEYDVAPDARNGTDATPPPSFEGTAGSRGGRPSSVVAFTEGGYNKVKEDAIFLGPLTKSEYEKLREKIKQRESSGVETEVNELGYIGWYQFGIAALKDLGYIKKNVGTANKLMDNKEVWTGRDGCDSKTSFLSNKVIQDKCFMLNAENIMTYLFNKGVPVGTDANKEKFAGLIAVGHLVGMGAAYEYTKGKIYKDGNKITSNEYFRIGFSSIRGSTTFEIPKKPDEIKNKAIDEKTASDPSAGKFKVIDEQNNTDAMVNFTGFTDPMGKYPQQDWYDESDLNRLARNQKVSNTIVSVKEEDRKENIKIALGENTWSQPGISYNAKYPYNNVFATEAGHVMEFDNTPENERINIHHNSGTFLEIDHNGSQTNKITGHGCTIIEKDGIILIEGSAHVHCKGDITLYSEKSLYIETGGDFNVKAKNINLNGEQTVSFMAPMINTNPSSASAIKKTMKYTGEFQDLSVNSRFEEEAITLENSKESQQTQSFYSELEAPEKNPERAPTSFKKKGGEYIFKCPVLEKFSPSYKLSTNFTLGDLCKKGLVPQNGWGKLSASEIVCNLQHLAINVLEPIKQSEFGAYLFINSGFRMDGGDSQHEKGMAVDLKFKDIRGLPNDRNLFLKRAVWLRELVPFDQMILEYTSSWVWIHVSFNKDKNRYNSFSMKLNSKTEKMEVISNTFEVK